MSLAAPFPCPPAPRRRGQGGKVASRGKRAPAKSKAGKSASPPNKKKKTAAAAGAAATAAAAAAAAAASGDQVPSDATAKSPERTPTAVAAWDLVRGKVKDVVHEQNKALWAAIKEAAAQLEHLRANAVRLEARVDAQGQGHERTVMAVASMRVAAEHGANAGRSRKGGRDTRGIGCGGGGGGNGGSGGSGSSGGSGGGIGGDGGGRVNDVVPVLKYEDVQAAAMALAPVNEEKAGQLRRPIRALVKKLIAKATLSRDILMDADTQTAVISEEVVKAFAVQADVAHSYLMGPVWFPADEGHPKKKRPISKITTTIPHTVAQIREFVLKPFFHVLGFSYNPMPVFKAMKWEKKDTFFTSYKGEKAIVAAAKNVFTKIGGGARIVTDRAGSHRFHVDMLVGHHALFASFVRNEFEIALGRRKRRRGGSGNGVYQHWVDEFTTSIKHLRKSHTDKKVHAGYRITDAIDPDMVMPTGGGRWAFSAPDKQPENLSAEGKKPTSTLTTAARPPRSTKSRAGVTGVPATHGVAAGASPNADDNDNDDEGGEAPPRISVVIVGDDDSDYRTGAALIGISGEGGGEDGDESVRGGSVGGGSVAGGDDEDESEGVGARTSSSDSDDSDCSLDGSVDDDDEEGPY